MQIRTKWHKIREMILSDNVYFTAPKNGRAIHTSEVGSGKLSGAEVLDMIGSFEKEVGDTAPKFIIDPELMDITSEVEFHKSILDMKRANVLRLPYPIMIVEYQHRDTHYMVVLRDVTSAKEKCFHWESYQLLDVPTEHDVQFYSIVFRMHKDNDGEYLVVSPSILYIGVVERHDGRDPWINVVSTAAMWADNCKDLVKKTNTKDGAAAAKAAFAALLLMSTEGVKREVIDVPKLNKTRERSDSNKAPIPKHTYITIGHVYRYEKGETSEQYNPRRSPRPHWRRGHNKNVRYGVGKTQIKLVYIPPKLVSFHPELNPTEPTVVKQYAVQK